MMTTSYTTDGSGIDHGECNSRKPTVWAKKKPGMLVFLFYKIKIFGNHYTGKKMNRS